ncbi:SEC-C metal-binding domain-containing protein [Mariniflexile sp.]|uniref:SEC-C metal-binding domain-containing protein n=1 Tax=Mariniflexile sp. TaxID=1979402 RepID=UPI0040472E61
MNGYTIFEREALTVLEKHKKLSFEIENGIPCVFGYIILYNEHGIVEDKYQVKIQAVDNYPHNFPLVFETGGRIPKNIDWHIFEQTGNCCIASPPEEIIDCNSGLHLLSFIDNQVKNYFYSQVFRNQNGYFLKERSHGSKGWIEFFEETFMTNNIFNIEFGLNQIIQGKKINRVSMCFCGSGKKYRKCHKKSYDILSKLSLDNIKLFLYSLKETNDYKIADYQRKLTMIK